MIKFGIVLPTYKRAKLLQRAIESILNQSYKNYMICVVEDCSPDDTQSLMQKYVLNEKIHYIRLKKNKGVNTARNTAINYLISNNINCDYLTMLDDDDYFLADTFSKANEILSSKHHSWLGFNRVTSDFQKITQVQHYDKEYTYLYDYFIGNKISGDIVMFINTKIIHNDRFEESIRAREYIFYIRLSTRANIFMYDFNAVVCEYLENGLTKESYIENEEEIKRVINIENKVYTSIGLSRKIIQCLIIKNALSKSFKSFNLERFLRYIVKYIKNCF